MVEMVSQEAMDFCRDRLILIQEGVQLGFGQPKSLLIEGPASLRRGTYEIDTIGAYSYLGGHQTSMRHIGTIGRFCSIASNIVCGQTEHPVDLLSTAPLFTSPMPHWKLDDFGARNRAMMDKAVQQASRSMAHRSGKISIGNDVWIGEGVYIRRGVTIGDGAVVAARSVVSGDVPPYAIVGGVPARVIRYRFEPVVIEALLALQWWAYGLNAVEDADFSDISSAITTMERNIAAGAEPFVGQLVALGEDGQAKDVVFDPDRGEFYFA